MSDKKKRSTLMDYASKFLDGLTGGKKPEVVDGVESKTQTLYSTYGSKSDSKGSSKAADDRSRGRDLPEDDPWFAYTRKGDRRR